MESRQWRPVLLMTVLLALIGLVRGQRPIMTIVPPPHSINVEGEGFKLTCQGLFLTSANPRTVTFNREQRPGGSQSGTTGVLFRNNNVGQLSDSTIEVNSTYNLVTWVFNSTATLKTEGQYRCAMYDSQVSYTLSRETAVRVAVAPTVAVKDTATAFEGSRATLLCNATGLPLPTLEWWYKGAKLTEATNALSLALPRPDVPRDQAGEYVCIATNKAGEVNGSTEFVVYYEPAIQVISRPMLLPVGSKLLLQCIATGLPAPQVAWLHHRHNLSLVPHLVLSRSREEHDAGLIGASNVSSVQVMAGDEGQYTCSAHNIAGHHRQHVQVTLQFRPDAPRLDHIDIFPTQTEIHLSWFMPDYHNSSITLYEVEQRSRDNMTWDALPVRADSLHSRNYVADDLTRYEEFEFRVRAQNGVGFSDYSSTTGFIRTLPRPPIAPDNVTVVEAQPMSILLEWQFPMAWTTDMGVLEKIIVRYNIDGRAEVNRTEFAISPGAMSGILVVSGLQKGTLYRFRVHTANSGFQGAHATVFANTTTTRPGNATSFVATVLSHERIRFMWTGVDDGGSPLTEVTLKLVSTDAGAAAEAGIVELLKKATIPALTAHTVTLSGFLPETMYRFRLTVSNANGAGRPRSKSDFVTTPVYQSPPAITALHLVKALAETATVRWNLSDYTTLLPITSYRFDWREQQGTQGWTKTYALPAGGRLSHVLEGLPRDKIVEVRMRAHNEYNASLSFSDVLVVRTLSGRPKKPTELLLVENGQNSIKLEWRLDESDDFPTVKLTLEIREIRGGVQHSVNLPDREINIVGTSGQYTLNGLKPSSSYSVKLFATSRYGRSLGNLEREFSTQDLPPTTVPTTSLPTGTVVKQPESSSNTMIIIIAAAAGGGLVLILLVVILVIFIKRRRTTHDGWTLGAHPASPKSSGKAVPDWMTDRKATTSPVAEHDTRYSGLQRGQSRKATPNESSVLSQPEMYETDHDLHPEGGAPTTFTSFSLAKQQEVQQGMEQPVIEDAVPPPVSPPHTPPPPPESLPNSPVLASSMPPPQYSSSPLVKKSHISDDHDLSHINQSETFAPLSQPKVNTDV